MLEAVTYQDLSVLISVHCSLELLHASSKCNLFQNTLYQNTFDLIY